MKWYGWTVFSLLLVAGAASALAVEPWGSDRSPTSSRRGFFKPAAIQQADATGQPERVGSETPVLYRQATWNIWAGTYNGYVYSPDACDYRPPCIDHLWDGYCQRPLRCGGLHWGCRHCGGDCGHCGHFGHRHGCGCGEAIGCDSCVSKAPACGMEMKPSCGAEPSCDCGGHGWHLGHHWNGLQHRCHHFRHGCRAHWSCACGADVSCGCGVEGKGDSAPMPDAGAPPAPMPELEEKKASAEVDQEVRPIKLPAIGTGLKRSVQR